MRVTNKMLSSSFLADMRGNLANMQKLQQQLTSGKEIRRPSDDPFKVARAMQLTTDINTNKQYNENITNTINWLDTTDTALGQAGNVLQRVRELLVSAGNAGYSVNERKAVKDEINQKVGELAQVLNTNFDGKYVFGGSRGTTKPVDVENRDALGNIKNAELFFYKNGGGKLATGDNELDMLSSKLQVEISQGVTMDYNVTSTDILKFTNEKGEQIDIADLFKRITNHLDGKNDSGTALDPTSVSKLTGDDLLQITDSITNLLRIRSEVGAKENRMDSAKDKNEEENFNMTELLSKTEDIDITQKTMEFATMQTVYTASLQTSARVIQPSLLDYLR
ncbi:flagellar hook-associated protein FlgL [Clostridium omnivorum]|uniref:Flagellar hook-associated protein 3 n=1 Tax=Clostridium omnivorum TaxID=1604902 RepID=A0ABQ5NAP0_9CLOT|nr:flagellar hook-associated protein FlgL [Clostridium sp. E14]GLC32324.1 flagellar hook-associated protein 3 [Clostridium sp. E14]